MIFLFSVFSLFNVVSFKNEGCRSNSGTTGISGVNRNGTCYTSSQCRNKGGSASGSCASGFGVCCLFTVQSGGTISENCTYIQNPGFPSGYTDLSSISWTVAKCSNGKLWIFSCLKIKGNNIFGYFQMSAL